MKKWLALGCLGLAVAWGPYLYVQISRSPAQAHGKGRMLAMFSGEDSEETETIQQPVADPEPAAADEPQPTAPAAKPAEDTKVEPEAPAEVATPENAQKMIDEAAKAAAAAAAEAAKAAADLNKGEPPPSAAAKPEVKPVLLPTELTPQFRKAFDNEPRDGFWAEAEEPRLTQLLHASGVPETAIDQVSCRKTVCRIQFSADDLEADVQNKFYGQVQQEFGSQLALDGSKPSAAAEDAPTALFILRRGYTLEH